MLSTYRDQNYRNMCFSWKLAQILLGTSLLYLACFTESDATEPPGVEPEILPHENVFRQEKFAGEEYFCIHLNNLAGIQIKGGRQMVTFKCFVMNGLVSQTPDTLGLYNCLSEAGMSEISIIQMGRQSLYNFSQ